MWSPRSGLALGSGLTHGSGMSDLKASIPPQRRSASADAALRAEIDRVARMTIHERVTAALSMRDRFSWITPVSKEK